MTVTQEMQQGSQISVLIDRAQGMNGEHREEVRYPFQQPVRVLFAGSEEECLYCFTRDISESGLGLLSNVGLPQQPVVIAFHAPEIKVAGTIVWCKCLAPGWYSCGMQFAK